MNIKAIIETAIYVADQDETEAFYRTILGLTVIYQGVGPSHFLPGWRVQCSSCFHCGCHVEGRSLTRSWSQATRTFDSRY
jgi:catechol 2,3-dioxygenase-like lactoylglutathione lyase family enzyme